MRKRFFAVLLGLVLITAFSGTGHAQRAKRPQSRAPQKASVTFDGPLAHAFADDTFLYFELNDLESLADEMGGVETLYQLLKTVFESEANPDGSSKKMPFSVEQFRAMLGSSLAIGMRVPKSTPLSQFGNVDPVVVGIVRSPSPETAAVAKQSLVEVARKGAGGSGRVTSDTVRGVNVLTLNGPSPRSAFAYGSVGDNVIFGTPAGVADVLELATAPTRRRLSDVPGFASASARVPPGRQMFSYFNAAPFVAAFNDSIDSDMRAPATRGKPGAVKPEAALAKRFIGMDALSGGSFSALAASGNLTIQGTIELDRTKGGLISVLSDPPAISLRAATILPGDTDFVAAGSVDLIRLVDLVFQFLTPAAAKSLGFPPPATLVEQFEQETGVRFRDQFLAAFGNEVLVAMSIDEPAPLAKVSQDAAAPQATTRTLFLAEVRDAETLGTVVSKFMSPSPEAKGPEMTMYEGVPVWTAGSFAWSFVDGFAVAGDRPDVIRLLDAVRTGRVLSDADDYRSTVGLPPNNTIAATYLSPHFIEWASKREGGSERYGRLFRTGLFFGIQKDAGGIYSNFQIPLPDLKVLLDTKTDTMIGRRRAGR